MQTIETQEKQVELFLRGLFGNSCPELELFLKQSHSPWEMLEKLLEFVDSLPLGQIHGIIDTRADVRDLNKIYLGEDSEIGPGVLIEGPVYLGNRVKIRHGAYIRGPVFIGDDCIVGHASEIKHSILFPHASAAHFNYVGNTILGERSQLGAGATCANLRFDRKPIIVRTKEGRYPTAHKKMGAFVGHDTKIGCQAVLSPGCVVAPHSIILPLTSVQGYYDRIK